MSTSLIWVDVPQGSTPRRCRGSTCGAVVYFALSPKGNGKMIPVDCNVDGAVEPTSRHAGRGVMHHQTCPDVKEFSAAAHRDRASRAR